MYKKLKEKIQNNTMAQLLMVACGAILFYTLVNHFSPVVVAFKFLCGVISPLFTGIVMAYLLRPIVLFLEYKLFKKCKRRKVAHVLAVIIAFLFALLIVFLIIYLIVPQLAESVVAMASNVENYANSLISRFNIIVEKNASLLEDMGMQSFDFKQVDWKSLIVKVTNWIGERSEGLIGAGLGAGKKLANTLIAMMFAVYILLDNDHLTKTTKMFVKSFMQKENYEKFSSFCSSSNKIFMNYLGGNLVDSLIIGIMCYIFMVAMKLPYAFLVTVVVAFTNFIPTFGPIIGLGICGFILLIVNPMGAFWFAIYTAISQFLDANVIKPVLLGDSTGLSPLWVLASIIIGGGLFGMAGMLLGVPVAAIISNVITEKTKKRLIDKGYIEPEDTEIS